MGLLDRKPGEWHFTMGASSCVPQVHMNTGCQGHYYERSNRPRFGCTWYLTAEWPHSTITGSAFVDDYGDLQWTQT